MNKPTITALITVQRTNNSNLPDSHIKDFGGLPLFQITIDKLLAVKAIHKIVISTDSDLVKKTYGSNGKISIIGLPHPDKFSDQHATERILEEMPTSDLITAHSLEKTDGEHFMQTQCINPLLSVKTIEEVIERYYMYVINAEHKQFDSVMSLCRIEKRLYDNSNYPAITLRNDPHFVIFEDTIFHVFNRTAFLKNNKQKSGNNPMFFEVPEIENLAIESPATYKLVKLVYDNKNLFQ